MVRSERTGSLRGQPASPAAAGAPRTLSAIGAAAAAAVPQHFHKTRFCKFYSLGACTRGAACSFAHRGEEVRDAPDFRRTKMCPSVKAGAQCSSATCTFAHKLEDVRKIVLLKPAPASPTKPQPLDLASLTAAESPMRSPQVALRLEDLVNLPGQNRGYVKAHSDAGDSESSTTASSPPPGLIPPGLHCPPPGLSLGSPSATAPQLFWSSSGSSTLTEAGTGHKGAVASGDNLGELLGLAQAVTSIEHLVRSIMQERPTTSTYPI